MTTCRGAILLAAGLGTRLRPLTQDLPKPLLPIGNKRLIDFPLERLARAGVVDVVINLHYLGEEIRRYVGSGEKYQLHVQYSEEPVILGTGGGIQQAAQWLPDPSRFFVINADVLCDVDLRKLWLTHERVSQAVATLAVRKLTAEENYTPLTLNAEGRLTGIGQGDHHYLGILVGTDRLLAQLPSPGHVSCLVKEGFQPLLQKDAVIMTHLHGGYWNDVGTLDRLEAVRKTFGGG